MTLRASARTARPAYGFVYLFVYWLVLLFSLPGLSHASGDTVHGSGALVLHHPDGDRDALSMQAHMDLQVQGLLASMTLVQTFSNTSDQWLAGSYLFPLPEDAAIRGLRINIGERTIIGRIRPREQADAEYQRAVQAGRIASLMEQQRPNLFTTRIANIAPRARVRVTLDVMLPVKMTGSEMYLNLPTTLTPRYLNKASDNARALQSDFVLPDRQPGPTLDVSMSIAPLASYRSVHSNMSSLQVNDQGLRIDAMNMDRDLTIRWPVQHDAATRMHAFVASHDDDRYVQLLVNPPEQSIGTEHQARELIIVLDKSGSMAGVSMRAAIEALNQAIDSLSSDDLLNIVAFDDRHYTLFNQSLAATDSVKQSARRFAAGLQADGGTEMESALAFALQDPARLPANNTTGMDHGRDSARNGRPARVTAGENDTGHRLTSEDRRDSGSAPQRRPQQTQTESTAIAAREADSFKRSDHRLKQIVFITDGSIGYEEALLKTIRSRLGDSRLFTVGIGAAPNRWFLEKAAQAGRGVSVSIQDESGVAAAIGELLDGLRFPVLTDIAIEYPQGQGEMYPQPVPDLYANRPALWVARIDKAVDRLVVTGKQEGTPFRETVVLPAASPEQHSALSSSTPAIAMHWARQKISSLEDEQRYSAEPEMNRQTITRIAMQSGLVTPYTSLIAVEDVPARPADAALGHDNIANRLPQGNLMTGIAMPQGAAGTDTLLYISLITGITGLALLTFSRQQKH